MKAKGEEVLSRRRRATGSSGSASGPIFQFFVPPASLSPGVIFVGFHLPGKPYDFLCFDLKDKNALKISLRIFISFFFLNRMQKVQK